MPRGRNVLTTMLAYMDTARDRKVSESPGGDTDSGESLTAEQLHGSACVVCGEAGGILEPAGHRYILDREGGRLGWPVAAHPEHAADAA
jgi:hypothetical protein